MSKRRFFQTQLSTAVVLMLVAGVLVWANVREREALLKYPDGTVAPANGPFFEVRDYGWPFVAYRKMHFFTETWYLHLGPSVLYDALIALAILLVVWQVCEWRIRRREQQKG